MAEGDVNDNGDVLVPAPLAAVAAVAAGVVVAAAAAISEEAVATTEVTAAVSPVTAAAAVAKLGREGVEGDGSEEAPASTREPVLLLVLAPTLPLPDARHPFEATSLNLVATIVFFFFPSLATRILSLFCRNTQNYLFSR